MYRMLIYKTYTPRPGVFVAIEDRGAFFFGVDDNYLHKDYVAMKLGLKGDAPQVADFLNTQLEKEHKQQGHYYRECISDVEVYGKIGEDKYMPWHPVIIGEGHG